MTLWLYYNPDTGTELSENHPVRSGECPDAENIRPATNSELAAELRAAWTVWAEDRALLTALRAAPEGGIGRSMTDEITFWRNPGLTPHARVQAIWTHFAPTSNKYLSMMEAMEAAIEAAVRDASEPPP